MLPQVAGNSTTSGALCSQQHTTNKAKLSMMCGHAPSLNDVGALPCRPGSNNIWCIF